MLQTVSMGRDQVVSASLTGSARNGLMANQVSSFTVFTIHTKELSITCNKFNSLQGRALMQNKPNKNKTDKDIHRAT